MSSYSQTGVEQPTHRLGTSRLMHVRGRSWSNDQHDLSIGANINKFARSSWPQQCRVFTLQLSTCSNGSKAHSNLDAIASRHAMSGSSTVGCLWCCDDSFDRVNWLRRSSGRMVYYNEIIIWNIVIGMIFEYSLNCYKEDKIQQ